MKKKIVAWLRKECAMALAKGIVVGLSGGVDSSVVASLAVQAEGKRNVVGLVMSIHSNPQDGRDAKIMAKLLGIKTKVIDLSKSYDSLLRVLPPAGALAKMNLKPRLRMLTLYYFANKLNYPVCGTGNKAELEVGYFTKHGDGAADLLPIGGLLKWQVRHLARELGIPEHIITKTPTAGLSVGQTDEGEMGISYAELDDILDRLAYRKKQILPRGTVGKVKKMIARSAHKRTTPKICRVE